MKRKLGNRESVSPSLNEESNTGPVGNTPTKPTISCGEIRKLEAFLLRSVVSRNFLKVLPVRVYVS